jgi:hypothetical protein
MLPLLTFKGYKAGGNGRVDLFFWRESFRKAKGNLASYWFLETWTRLSITGGW